MPETLRDLHHLARLHGVQTWYADISGKRREASPEALVAVLKALRVDIDLPSDAEDALQASELLLAGRGLEPVFVAWNGQGPEADLRLPKDQLHSRMRCTLHLEQGDVQESEYNLDDFATLNPVSEEGLGLVVKRFRLPSGLPHGYHRLELEVGGKQYEALIISAPEQAWSSGKRNWGGFLPLYSIRSERNWGAGNFSDLEAVAHWLGELGGSVVGTLPLLPAYLDEPCDPSPYSPVSRLFWNEFYVDLSRIPELSDSAEAKALIGSADARREIESLRATGLVDYRRVMALKRQALMILTREFFERRGPRFKEFERYLVETPEVTDYAEFRAVHHRLKVGWPIWPDRLREGVIDTYDYEEEVKRYYLYSQWIAAQQLEHLSKVAGETGTALYLDLPLGVRGDGYDVWRHREEFVTTASAGAPPDALFTKGQDWGFCPLHPQSIRERHYKHFVDFIRHHLKYAKFLRIDHVMQFHRLFYVPHGMPATDGVYVHYRMEEFFAILSLESHRAQVGVIGENLGTVPPEINEGMDRHRLSRMYIVQYEFQMDPGRDVLRGVPQSVLASLNTHDMPPFAAWYEGTDIADRMEMGLMDQAAADEERRGRENVKSLVVQWLSERGFLEATEGRPPDAKSVADALHNYLAGSPAELLMVNLEDLWSETQPQNVPGTTIDVKPNWQRKTAHAWEEFRRMPQVVEALKAVDRLRKQGQ